MVKRSAVKMWALAMAGIPLLVISLDVLTNRRITNWLREIIFKPEDTQIYEPRDVISPGPCCCSLVSSSFGVSRSCSCQRRSSSAARRVSR